MSWPALLEPDIQSFIHQNEHEDIRKLALRKPPNPDWPYPLIIDQIKARQKARKKLPHWPDFHPDIIFPSAHILEQASSTATAHYKATLVKGKTFCDLTGGTGVDSCALTKYYESGTCIDCDSTNVEILSHNLQLLKAPHCRIEVCLARAEDFIKIMPLVDLTIIDPQRRNSGGKGKFRLEDCSPSITELLPTLREKSSEIMLKTSPILDIHQAVTTLKNVEAVHILEWNNECKEVVYIIGHSPSVEEKKIPVTAVKLDETGDILSSLTFTKEEEENAVPRYGLPEKYLYEPGPAFLKSGGFNTLAKTYNLKKLHKHTHLYTSDTLQHTFPGRTFETIGRFSAHSKSLPFSKANLTIRNFPAKTDNLKKKLKLKDGGQNYLFACTLFNEEKTLLHGRKI